MACPRTSANSTAICAAHFGASTTRKISYGLAFSLQTYHGDSRVSITSRKINIVRHLRQRRFISLLPRRLRRRHRSEEVSVPRVVAWAVPREIRLGLPRCWESVSRSLLTRRPPSAYAKPSAGALGGVSALAER